jgi:ubiquinone/menaquinone biosynthesis C-methylase UbiE
LDANKLNEERIWANWKTFNLWKIKRHEIRYFLEKILPMHSSWGRVLEIGAGSCWASALLKLKYPRSMIFASDVSESALKKGIEIARSLSSNIDFFVACDSERLPFRGDLFDHVYGNAILHHFQDAYKGVSEIYRVLKNGGSYVGGGELMANIVLKKVWSSRFGRAGKREIKEGIKENIYTFDEWMKIFYNCGFHHVEIRQNKYWRYKTTAFPLTYMYYLTISSLPSSIVKVFLATDIDLIAVKSL